MKIRALNCLTVGLAAFGMLAIAPSSSAQTTKLQESKSEVEHLTCVKDAQGLMCKADDLDNQPVAAETTASTTVNEQLGHVSDALLGCLYFVLPAGLGLAIFLRDKQSELLSAQIERLEKLWSQDSQQ